MNGESLEKIDPEKEKFSYQFCFASRRVQNAFLAATNIFRREQ